MFGMNEFLLHEDPQNDLQEAYDALSRVYDYLEDENAIDTSEGGRLVAAMNLVEDLRG